MALAGQDGANVGHAKWLLNPLCENQRLTESINTASHKEEYCRRHSARGTSRLKCLHHFLDSLVPLPFSMYPISNSGSQQQERNTVKLEIRISEFFMLSL